MKRKYSGGSGSLVTSRSKNSFVDAATVFGSRGATVGQRIK